MILYSLILLVLVGTVNMFNTIKRLVNTFNGVQELKLIIWLGIQGIVTIIGYVVIINQLIN